MSRTDSERSKVRRLRLISEGKCLVCCVDKEDKSKSRCSKCLSIQASHSKALRERRAIKGRCKGCGGEVSSIDNKNCDDCRRKGAERSARSVQEAKVAAYTAYGGCRCVCCGETEPVFLSLDHMDGSGSAHRKEIGPGAQIYFWLKRKRYPPGFQVLCHNCNLGRHLNGGVCPHKQVVQPTPE